MGKRKVSGRKASAAKKRNDAEVDTNSEVKAAARRSRRTRGKSEDTNDGKRDSTHSKKTVARRGRSKSQDTDEENKQTVARCGRSRSRDTDEEKTTETKKKKAGRSKGQDNDEKDQGRNTGKRKRPTSEDNEPKEQTPADTKGKRTKVEIPAVQSTSESNKVSEKPVGSKSVATDDEEEDKEEPKPEPVQQHKHCPYLDTVNRQVLNFDFEKVCSVSLVNHNVYVCLVCGKYFHGRGHGTPAVTHSLQVGHFVFMNLETSKIYSLPDNFEVVDPSLDDIKYNLRPTYTSQEIAELSLKSEKTSDIFGLEYVPGFSPMNDLSQCDYFNTTMQALSHVIPLRDFFLVSENYKDSKSTVTKLFGELVCKLWNSRKLKASVSAHELVQAISVASGKKFRIGEQVDCTAFLKWFLHELHMGVGGSHKPGSSIIHQCFQGMVEVEVETVVASTSKTITSSSASSSSQPTAPKEPNRKSLVPSLILSLDLPGSPLFKDSRDGKSLIPEIEMEDALEKFKGQKGFDAVRGGKLERKYYRIVKLPPYIVFHMNRFTKTDWSLEKNHTIVHLPVDMLDMSQYLSRNEQVAKNLEHASVSELKTLAKEHGIDIANVVEKPHLRKLVSDQVLAASSGVKTKKKKKKRKNLVEVASLKPVVSTRYRLIANICHKTSDEGELKERLDVLQDGSYICQLLNRPKNSWYDMQNLHIRSTIPQLVSCSESLIAFYENI